MSRARELAYYAREGHRRLRHYAEKRLYGYRHRGTLEEAAAAILRERAERGFEAGGHFRGVWPRDLCFAAAGLSARGYEDALAETGRRLVDSIADVFYTDFHADYDAATPAEGVDTFPALVIVLAACDRLESRADALATLAALHREKFFDAELSLVTGGGSSWWDSAAAPRETYNTAVLLAAIERLETAGIDTVYTGRSTAVRTALLDELWAGDAFAERRGSTVRACDANVVPLYFGLVDEGRARRIATALEPLETDCGTRLRARPFAPGEVHPFFLLHRDYHYHVWPWNSFMYAVGLDRYGLEARAAREAGRAEAALAEHGNFLEVLTGSGDPYVKRGYASAEDFTVAAALWAEYRSRRS